MTDQPICQAVVLTEIRKLLAIKNPADQNLRGRHNTAVKAVPSASEIHPVVVNCAVSNFRRFCCIFKEYSSSL